MSSASHIQELRSTSLRSHYEGLAHKTLREIGKHWAVLALAAIAAGYFALVIIGPRCTAEAIVQLNLNPAASSAGCSQTQAIAAADASSLVEAAAQVIRSRSTASAVVARLGLDKDPPYARRSSWALVLASLQPWLQMPWLRATSADLATDTLLQQINVTNEPRPYLISIRVTSRDPEQAANLTDPVALKCLRRESVRDLASEKETAKHNFAEIGPIYGVRHPS